MAINYATFIGYNIVWRAVGIVIDDVIVVLENIFRYIEEKHCLPFEVAIQGTREVALAVMVMMLSLVVIFLLIAFMNGYVKRFINPFGWMIAFAILVLMFVSFMLMSMFSSWFLRLFDVVADSKMKECGFFYWFDGWYMWRVNWVFDYFGIIIGISIVMVLLTILLNRMVGCEFVSNEDMGEWIVYVDVLEGMSLEGISEIVFKFFDELYGIEGVAQIESSVGVLGMVASLLIYIHFLCQALLID